MLRLTNLQQPAWSPTISLIGEVSNEVKPEDKGTEESLLDIENFTADEIVDFWGENGIDELPIEVQ